MLITDIDKFIESQFNFLRDYISRYKFNKSLKKDISGFVSYYEKFINSIDYSKLDVNQKKISLTNQSKLLVKIFKKLTG